MLGKPARLVGQWRGRCSVFCPEDPSDKFRDARVEKKIYDGASLMDENSGEISEYRPERCMLGSFERLMRSIICVVKRGCERVHEIGMRRRE
jgi:hypothetical protein